MIRKETAKFGVTNNESIIDRFKTQITENIGRSELFIPEDHSHMNVSELQIPKADYILIDGTHRIPAESGTTYRCPICDRLRAICPSKSYKTYEYCQRCPKPEQTRKTRPKIFSHVDHSFSKDLNSTYNQTKGYSMIKPESMNKHLQEVNKVRFVQTNNVYPLKVPVSSYETGSSRHEQQKRERATSAYVQREIPATSHHHLVREKVLQPANVEEIIYYPVIHNKLVYKSASQEQAHLGRSRYRSQHSGKKPNKRVDKLVSDFLKTTLPDEVLTPVQFKTLADSMYRQKNPHIQQQ